MHNSFWPIISVLLFTSALLIALLGQGGDLRGMSGPALMPGVYPTTDKPLAMPPTEDLVIASSVQIDSDEDGEDHAPWDEVALVLEDDSPVTAAFAKALAEALVSERGGVYSERDPSRYFMVIFVTKDEATVPLNVARVWRIRGPEFIPSGRPGVWNGQVQVSQRDPVAAGPIPRGTFVPKVGVRSVDITVSGSVETVADSVSWPQWYAGLGRSLADAAITSLVDEPASPLAEWGSLAIRHGEWVERHPEPPRHKLIQWQAKWQYPAVRGWTGRIVGKTFYKLGKAKDSLEAVNKLLARGQWVSEGEDDSGVRRYTHRSEKGVLRELAIADADFGYYIRMVQVHPNALQGGMLQFDNQTPGNLRILRGHLGVGFPEAVETRINELVSVK